MQFSGTCKDCDQEISSPVNKREWYDAIIAHRKVCKPLPRVGQRFQECDNRFTRIVEVVAVKDGKAQLKTITPAHDRLTWARFDRFFKRSHGYRILGGRCHECQIAAGAQVPKGGHLGITVSLGICGGCLKMDATLVPSCDYHWPKQGRKAVFD